MICTRLTSRKASSEWTARVAGTRWTRSFHGTFPGADSNCGLSGTLDDAVDAVQSLNPSLIVGLMSRLHQSTCRSEHVSRTSNLYPDTVSVSIEGSLVRLNTSLLSSPNPRIQVRYRKGPRDTPCRTICAIVLHRKTKTNTNSNPDPNRYRRRCPDPNARIDYRSLYITWQ